MNETNERNAHRRLPAAAILIVPVITALVLTLFAWPNARLKPRELPIGVAGPAAGTAEIAQRLATQGDGAFDLHTYRTEAEARSAIEDRDVYGAFVVSADGVKVLTASAASPAVAQLLDHAAAQSPGAKAAQPEVEDVAPAPRGAALGSSVLPLVLAGIVTGVLTALVGGPGSRRIWLVIAGSLLAGLSAAAIVQGWLDIVEGDWVANAAVLSVAVLAIASVVAGAFALFGERGAAIAALMMVLIGNPFSGVASAPELLPEPVGGIGQLMPPGAGGNLLRSTGFFDGAGGGEHAIVLAVWVLGGLGMIAAANARERRLRRVADEAVAA
jgi:hypothetical protein